ncbi:hypothetical protein AVO45_00815 [Ruegeria marisrubri]|uniref:UPF0229 protein AVO45_00815 n=1 Tax=Ruegeria marisrubri TaxID=1685379 RepID=A0A101CY84_9RHOB|nr:YeaH/YhbH family protein [Ruegeria marisrubri]KUJ85568.1 hypothetical protein AVO45_00815 [Ruegeria marisrubri]
MGHFVDRRLNPKDKSLGNRRRFLRRVRNIVKQSVLESVRRRAIADVDQGEQVSVPAGGISEPSFRHASEGGRRERVLPGNKSFRVGDRIAKPKGGAGQGGREGSAEGEGEDDFVFMLSRDEFLDIFFDNLELPDLVKRNLKEIHSTRPRRKGFAVTGTPATLSVERTMRTALGRRIALGRIGNRKMRELVARIRELEALTSPTPAQLAELAELQGQLKRVRQRRRLVPFVDPLDVRYKHYVQEPEPSANAVMFCLMDVSASMGQREKDLAKRFFVLLHLFLRRRYERTDLVFIRHTQVASEVDEETFFHSRETGGTVVSSALVKMKEIIEERYPPSDWNIYAAQASDGENFGGDSKTCAEILDSQLMRLCQYFAYIEIIDEKEAELLTSEDNGMELWRAYLGVSKLWPQFAMKRIAGPADIYPVFRELFEKQREKGHG